MGIIAKGVGKLILFGEYSVLWGFPGLGISLGMETLIAREGERKIPHGFLNHIKEVLPQYAASLHQLYVTSSVPIANGLGSSAALCVALARYVLGKRSVWKVAHRLEQFFHHLASGMDTGLAEEPPGTIWAFRFGKGELPQKTAVHIDSGALVFSGVTRPFSTSHQVQSVMNDHNSSIITRLGKITEWVLHRLSDWRAVAESAEAAQKELFLLGCNDPLLEEAIRVGKTAGAWGGKMSGSGGSFCLFCQDFDVAQRVRNHIRDALGTRLTVPPQIIDFSSSAA